MIQFHRIHQTLKAQFRPSGKIDKNEFDQIQKYIKKESPDEMFYMRGDEHIAEDMISMVLHPKIRGIRATGFPYQENLKQQAMYDNKKPSLEEMRLHTSAHKIERLISVTSSTSVAFAFASCYDWVASSNGGFNGYVYFIKSTDNKTIYSPAYNKGNFREAEHFATSFIPLENIIAFCKFHGHNSPNACKIEEIHIRENLSKNCKNNIISCMVFNKRTSQLTSEETVFLKKLIGTLSNTILDEEDVHLFYKRRNIAEKRRCTLRKEPGRFILDFIEQHCLEKRWANLSKETAKIAFNNKIYFAPKHIAKIANLLQKNSTPLALKKVMIIIKNALKQKKSLKSFFFNTKKTSLSPQLKKVYYVLYNYCAQVLQKSTN